MASTDRVKQMKFETVYPLYLAKVEKKGRTKEELDEILTWLTGYTNPSRYMDKVVDELAKGKSLEKIKRITS